MKALNVLLIVLLLSLYNALQEEYSCEDFLHKPTQASDCHGRKKDDGYIKCCYQYNKYYSGGSLKEEKKCVQYNQTQMDGFVATYKSMKGNIESNGGSYEKLDWNCSSNYIYISLLSLMIFLL